jgi:hypothetical protein
MTSFPSSVWPTTTAAVSSDAPMSMPMICTGRWNICALGSLPSLSRMPRLGNHAASPVRLRRVVRTRENRLTQLLERDRAEGALGCEERSLRAIKSVTFTVSLNVRGPLSLQDVVAALFRRERAQLTLRLVRALVGLGARRTASARAARRSQVPSGVGLKRERHTIMDVATSEDADLPRLSTFEGLPIHLAVAPLLEHLIHFLLVPLSHRGCARASAGRTSGSK